MPVCVICGAVYTGSRELTCSQPCHDKLIDYNVAKFGEFKKVVRVSTGEEFKVPTRDILERGIQEQDLDRYPRWEEKWTLNA